MRIEERARFRTQLAETETRFEGALVQRLNDVERKEQEADARIRKREADSAKLMFTERQRVLEKIDSTAALEVCVVCVCCFHISNGVGCEVPGLWDEGAVPRSTYVSFHFPP